MKALNVISLITSALALVAIFFVQNVLALQIIAAAWCFAAFSRNLLDMLDSRSPQ